MNRRTFFRRHSRLYTAGLLLADDDKTSSRLGLCSFSCLQQWQAVRSGQAGTKFHDAASFFDYARSLGADGVQTSIHADDAASARAIRARLDKDAGLYFEGELRLPEKKSDVPAFEAEVKLATEAGATVARSVLMGSRRYETFKTLDEFRAFHDRCAQRLAWVEPVLAAHKLKLAIENHKDHLAQEFVDLLRKVSSEWIGALVDTGNNMALLEEPHAVVELLAPLALSVHFKDMAVQTADDGLLLSEVVLGDGCLDLPRIVGALRKANPRIVFNIEMATRDPLHIPCLTDNYWATFPERREKALGPAMAHGKANPPRHPVPRVAGLDTPSRIALEEANNRACISYARKLLA